MFRKLSVRLFTIIFLPLVACQLPGGQLWQPTELPTPVPSAQPAVEPTTTPIVENSLAFETVAINEMGGDIKDTNPGLQLLLLTSQDGLQRITDWVNPETATSLQQVNLAEFSVIALFRGWHPSTNYRVVIEKIVLQEDKLVIYTQFWEPAPNMESGAAETSPYHLVKIDKKLLPSVSVELVSESRAVSETSAP